MNARTGREAPQSTVDLPAAPSSSPSRLSGDEVQAAIVVQIKAEMGALGWKQPTLAAAAGLYPSTLHRYLSGARDLPMPVLVELADALGLSLTELMARAQNRFDAS